MSFVRTVLGDISPDQLGVCYSHEHIIIDDSVASLKFPAFRLASEELATAELAEFYSHGGRAMIDSMPCDAGRNVLKLARISRKSRVHIICPTGLHLPKYYDDGHWSQRLSADQIANLFEADIRQGIDRHDYGCPIVERTPYRAGIIKIASSGGRLTVQEQKLFSAAAATHLRTGCPILTHCEDGKGALEQCESFAQAGVDLSHVVLSHTDRQPDPSYHREVLSTGIRLEYDSCFRWKNQDENPSLALLLDLLPEFPGQLLLGMDAARPGYWKSYGGSPGLSFLLETFLPMMKASGLAPEQIDSLFTANPAAAFQFGSSAGSADDPS